MSEIFARTLFNIGLQFPFVVEAWITRTKPWSTQSVRRAVTVESRPRASHSANGPRAPLPFLPGSRFPVRFLTMCGINASAATSMNTPPHRASNESEDRSNRPTSPTRPSHRSAERRESSTRELLGYVVHARLVNLDLA